MTKVCPECESNELLVYEETAWELNSGNFYCHAVKMHDSCATISCLTCDYTGKLKDAKEVSNNNV